MAMDRKSSRRGRSGDPRKRAGGQSRAAAEATPELADAVAEALELGHPIDIAMLASSLLAGLATGSEDGESATELPAPQEFVRMFLDSGDPDMLVFAWVIARLLSDAALQAAADRAVDVALLPAWLSPLDRPEVVAAWQTTDRLRDSTDIVLGVRLGEADLSLIGLVDFNSGAAVKDAFAVPVPLADVRGALSASGQTGMEARNLPPADARAWLTAAIAAGRAVQPPFESDTWPQIRPLLEWALRWCPTGGQGWHRRTWTPEEIAEVVAQFAGSPRGDVVADPADQAVLVDALSTLGRQTYGDPLLLSAVKLEIGLGHLWSAALHHDLDRLLALPDALGPYVSWAHDQRDVPAEETENALATIAHRRAEYSRDVAAIIGLDLDDT